MKKDIADRQDIDLLLHTFYNELLKDNTINYIFTDVVKIDMEVHLPIIANFWESILLHKNLYHNNPIKIHLDMN
ncbi:MAG: group III truncated hemoglobin, partial [Ginsengibacter sp.]